MNTVQFEHLMERFRDNVARQHGFLLQQSSFAPDKQRQYDTYLRQLDRHALAIVPVLLRSQGLVPVREMSRLIRAHLRNRGAAMESSDIDRITAYCTDRYAMLLHGSYQQSAGVAPASTGTQNSIGIAIGRIVPVSVERAKPVPEENRGSVVTLHELARDASRAANALVQQAGQDIRRQETTVPDVLLQSQRVPQVNQNPGLHVPVTGVMCPTLVALFSLVNPEVYQRCIEADVARVTSAHLRGEPIRSKPDARLYHALTTDAYGNVYHSNVYDELVARSKLHRALKQMIVQLRSGTLDRSSHDFYLTMPEMEMKQQPFQPPELVVRAICRALSLYPLVHETLPRTLDFRGRTYRRIGYLSSFLPFADSFPSMKDRNQRYPLIPRPTGPEYYIDGSGIYKKFSQVRRIDGPLWVTVSRVQPLSVLRDPSMPSNVTPPPESRVVTTPMTIPMVVGPLKGVKGARVSEDCNRNHPDNKNLRSVVCIKESKDHTPAGYHCYVASGAGWYRYDPDRLLRVNTRIRNFEAVPIQTAQRDWESHGVLFCFS